MKTTTKTLLGLLLLFSSFLQAQIPIGYYDNANGTQGINMQIALHDIIDNHTSISYGGIWTSCQTTDKKANGKVWDMYSDIPNGTPPYEFTFGSNQCGTYANEGDCYNREHSFPKSWFNDVSPMNTDIFHIYPTDGKVNGQRSNYPFGEVSSPTWTSLNGCKLGPNTTSGYSGTVFEPIDEYKGDFARTYFYMATRYYNEDNNWATNAMMNGAEPKPWALDMLYQWHIQDPVSQKEIDRNEAVFAIQHNRNPYIDHPEWVSTVWSISNNPTIITNIIITPVNPSTSQTVNISAEITDNDGIKLTELYWGTNTSTVTNLINMTNTTVNTYSSITDIPAQTNSNVVYYKIVVTDSANNISSSLISNYGTPVSVTDLLNEDFQTATDQQDIALSGWTTYSEVGNLNWIGRTYDQANLYTQFSSYSSGEQNTSWLITPKVNLDNTNNEIFSFDINVGYWNHDCLSVLMSQDFDGTNVGNATWVDISSNFTIPSAPATGYGVFATAGDYNLDSYNGDINIAFKYVGSDPDKTTTYQIDNVQIVGEVIINISNNDTKMKAEIFPNPISESINIKLEGNMLLNVRIHNVIGQLVFEKQISHNNFSTLDTKNLEKGVYFLQIQNNNEQITRKIIKQ